MSSSATTPEKGVTHMTTTPTLRADTEAKRGRISTPKWKIALIVVLVLPVAALLALLTYREAVQYSLRQQPPVNSPSGIESLEEIELGGVKQSILIRGADRTKPVLLWLHGGPGGAAMPGAHRYDKELVKHFVVVHWDQRGAGKSYDPVLTASDLTTQKYVSDTHELVKRLKDRFGEQKIYLVGHSWGTALGALTVERYPKDFYAFVGLGQLVNPRAGDKITYVHVLEEARERDNAEAVQELEELGPPPWNTAEQIKVIGKWNAEFGGTTHKALPNPLLTMALSPAYSVRDAYSYIKGSSLSVHLMMDDLWRIDLFEQVPRLEVPVYIFQGHHDYQTPGRWPSATTRPW